jgi:hypothetical protein
MFMRYLLTIYFLIATLCMSCDGRRNANEALKESVSIFNKKQASIAIISYYPKEYTELVTDTIISKDFKVSIKNYSVMNKNVIGSNSSKNKPKSTTYHRVFESEIIVYKASKDIFRTTISAEQFKGSDVNPFWNNATFEHAWVHQETSNEDEINLKLSFINPQTKSYKIYQMTIDSYGKQGINLLEEHI